MQTVETEVRDMTEQVERTQREILERKDEIEIHKKTLKEKKASLYDFHSQEFLAKVKGHLQEFKQQMDHFEMDLEYVSSQNDLGHQISEVVKDVFLSKIKLDEGLLSTASSMIQPTQVHEEKKSPISQTKEKMEQIISEAKEEK